MRTVPCCALCCYGYCVQDYLEAKEEFDRLPQQWKSNIRRHGHVHQYHTIVIDCAPMLFVDAAGVEVLLKVGGKKFTLHCSTHALLTHSHKGVAVHF